MKKILFAVITIVSFTACHKEFLEEKTFSQIAVEQFFKTADDAVMAVNAAYSLLAEDTYYDNAFILMSDAPADMMLTEWHNPLDDYRNLDNTNKDVNTFWNAAWKVNAHVNLVMEKVKDIPMDDALKSRILGEASFIRALNYFNLVRFFGHIPLILENVTEIEKMKVEQVPSDRIYERIIRDLEFASDNLPDSYDGPDTGRGTKWAAKSLLARVYLTMAGYREDPLSGEIVKGDEKYYRNTADLCREVIMSGRFDLFEKFSDNFEDACENGIEDIFSVQYGSGFGGYKSRVGTAKTPRFVPKGSKLALVEWKTYAAEQSFYDRFPDDDRKKATFLVSYLDENDALVEMPSPILPYPFVRKYLSDIQEGSNKQYKATDGRDYGDDYPVIRFADILLMYTEALNEIHGPEYDNGGIENTLYGINRVRIRAHARPYTAADCGDRDQFRSMILDERGWELCFEGHGWFDYVRQGVLVEKLFVAGRAVSVSPHNYLMPVPFQAIQTNHLLKQNFGY